MTRSDFVGMVAARSRRACVQLGYSRILRFAGSLQEEWVIAVCALMAAVRPMAWGPSERCGITRLCPAVVRHALIWAQMAGGAQSGAVMPDAPPAVARRLQGVLEVSIPPYEYEHSQLCTDEA